MQGLLELKPRDPEPFGHRYNKPMAKKYVQAEEELEVEQANIESYNQRRCVSSVRTGFGSDTDDDDDDDDSDSDSSDI